ncbi:unnamed protein product [Penicillium salamii]|uniref:Uncharacterized protein n=1 Tax=Penicillium salamii TaxID=1612424 RepID=A0A9W4NKK8_9EURO|nr:unnamed protein product [Penicillium salamii]CAG8380997.1 unnamed protein product [Penicillium salamii]CAG8389265.1 unnamed protein product [Penicillium salamii]
MLARNSQEDVVPEYISRMEKVPAPFLPPRSSYGVDGLSRAMIAWMLDINIRASIKRREFERTRIRICLYIKHMERVMTLNNITFVPYSDKLGNEMIRDARNTFKSQMVARMLTAGPIPLTSPIREEKELCGTVSDAQTLEYKLHQLEVIRHLGRADPPSLEEFNASRRQHRPQTDPRR